MSDDKLAIEEARRAAQHESVKSQVEGEVKPKSANAPQQKQRAVNPERSIRSPVSFVRRQLTRSLTLSAKWSAHADWREFRRSSITSSG